jgi:hypothetical protein
LSKLYQKRLEQKYGKSGYHGRKLQAVMKEIIAHNTIQISDSMARFNYKKFELKKGNMVLPNLEKVMPAHSVYVRKAQIQGDSLKQKLKDQMTNSLRGVLKRYDARGIDYKKGKGYSLQRRGQIKNAIVMDFEKEITGVFEGYVKKNPQYEMPGNIHAIAVTETRSVIDHVKKEFKDGVLKQNPDFICEKTWIQNRQLAKEPRRSHSAVNGKTIPHDQPFTVPLFQKIGKRWYKTGKIITMDHPHDPKAPAGEVIQCNCEAIYTFSKRGEQ